MAFLNLLKLLTPIVGGVGSKQASHPVKENTYSPQKTEEKAPPFAKEKATNPAQENIMAKVLERHEIIAGRVKYDKK